MNTFLDVTAIPRLVVTHMPYKALLKSIGGGVLEPWQVILGIAGVIVICILFILFMWGIISFFTWKNDVMHGKNVPEAQKSLTKTQHFILAASSPTIGNNYKCVIDIWNTRQSEAGKQRAVTLYEWGWGKLTCENAKKCAEDCMTSGYNRKYEEYCNATSSEHLRILRTLWGFTDFQMKLLEEMKQKYPKQGMLGWDLVRALSVVGGAYMGGCMEYEEASEIALKACRLLQENFSSWDDMVGSYTLGYQFWRGKRKTDRLKYYKKLRKSWIYNIAWDTPLKETEL